MCLGGDSGYLVEDVLPAALTWTDRPLVGLCRSRIGSNREDDGSFDCVAQEIDS